MRRFILKLLGCKNLLKEVQDLKLTIESLKDNATKTYKIYEEAFCFIKGLNIKDKEGVMWWEKNIPFDGNNYETLRIVERIKKSKEIEFVEQNPSLKIHKVFHGGCLGCVTPLEEGIGKCLGCEYLRGITSGYPDLSKKIK